VIALLGVVHTIMQLTHEAKRVLITVPQETVSSTTVKIAVKMLVADCIQAELMQSLIIIEVESSTWRRWPDEDLLRHRVGRSNLTQNSNTLLLVQLSGVIPAKSEIGYHNSS